jgi:hypothetical protein
MGLYSFRRLREQQAAEALSAPLERPSEAATDAAEEETPAQRRPRARRQTPGNLGIATTSSAD